MISDVSNKDMNIEESIEENEYNCFNEIYEKIKNNTLVEREKILLAEALSINVSNSLKTFIFEHTKDYLSVENLIDDNEDSINSKMIKYIHDIDPFLSKFFLSVAGLDIKNINSISNKKLSSLIKCLD